MMTDEQLMSTRCMKDEPHEVRAFEFCHYSFVLNHSVLLFLSEPRCAFCVTNLKSSVLVMCHVWFILFYVRLLLECWCQFARCWSAGVNSVVTGACSVVVGVRSVMASVCSQNADHPDSTMPMDHFCNLQGTYPSLFNTLTNANSTASSLTCSYSRQPHFLRSRNDKALHRVPILNSNHFLSL